ncbi:hypothetical protein GGR54DRAFT_597598 [Hypoxylon sp. NC1633]|nr:hypothetical protein GGR54DRAFT_597598 [Hypoxylon sp. NC1633]
MGTAKPYFIFPGYAFVAYPNRGLDPSKERFVIPDTQTIIRGALRYQGIPEDIRVLVDAEQDTFRQSVSWKEATQKIEGPRRHYL